MSAKTIISLAAMSQLANAIGKHEDAIQFNQTAFKYLAIWEKLGKHSSGEYFKSSFNDDDNWSLLFSLYYDQLLGTNIIPQEIFGVQNQWYSKYMNKYGMPFDGKSNNTISEFSFITFATSKDSQLRNKLYSTTDLYLQEIDQKSPMHLYYNTIKGNATEISNSSNMGAMFAHLALKKSQGIL